MGKSRSEPRRCRLTEPDSIEAVSWGMLGGFILGGVPLEVLESDFEFDYSAGTFSEGTREFGR